MRTGRIRLSFHGIHVQARIYEPEGEVRTRALFVSSPLGDPASWSTLLNNLCREGVLCVSADLPGFGANPVSPDVPQDNDTRARILWGILDEIEWRRHEEQRKWHLVGHGSGCTAVMTMALYQPDSTLSMALLSPVLDRFTIPPVHAFMASTAGEGLLNSLYRRHIENEKGFASLLGRLYGEPCPPERAKALHKMLTRKGIAASLARHMREGYKLNRDVYALKTQTMIIWGELDRIFGAQIPPRLQRRLPNAETHVQECAHMSMETVPDVIGDYLRGWFTYTEGKAKNVVKKARNK